MTDRVESMQIDLDELVSLRQQLAECQAREKVLRDALEQWDRLIDHQFTGSSEAMTALQQAADTGADALAMPSDSDKEK